MTTATTEADERRQRLRRILDRVHREGRAISRSDDKVHELFPVAITPAEGEALREWIRREGATASIEIGLGYAISTLVISEGLLATGHPRVRHVAIDPNQATRFGNCGLQLLEDAGLAELVEFYPEPSELALPTLLAEDRTFDLAFVDGNHRFDGVFVDLVYLGRLVRAGGIVFLDDYQLPAIARAASFFRTNHGWALEEVSGMDEFHQWAVLRTSTRTDTRAFDYYVDF